MSLISVFGVSTTKAFLNRCCKCGSSISERNSVFGIFRDGSVRRYSTKLNWTSAFYKNSKRCSTKFPRPSSHTPSIFILRARLFSTTSAAFDLSQSQWSDSVGPIPEPPPVPVDSFADIAVTIDNSLHGLGLGSYFTPSGLLQNALDEIYAYTGWPWWGVIIGATFCMRILITPVVIKAQKNAAKLQINMPEMQKIQQRIRAAQASGDQLKVAEALMEYQAMMESIGFKATNSFVVLGVQSLVFLSYFFALRGMATAGVEGFSSGGALWFTDLTIADPYYALPLISAATMWVVLKVGSESGIRSDTMAGIMRYVVNCFPVIVFFVGMKFPAAIVLYWATSNTISLAQAGILRIPRIRQALDIPQMKKHDPSTLPVQKGFIESVKEGMKTMKGAQQVTTNANIDAFKKYGSMTPPKTFSYDPTKVKMKKNPNATTGVQTGADSVNVRPRSASTSTSAKSR